MSDMDEISEERAANRTAPAMREGFGVGDEQIPPDSTACHPTSVSSSSSSSSGGSEAQRVRAMDAALARYRTTNWKQRGWGFRGAGICHGMCLDWMRRTLKEEKLPDHKKFGFFSMLSKKARAAGREERGWQKDEAMAQKIYVDSSQETVAAIKGQGKKTSTITAYHQTTFNIYKTKMPWDMDDIVATDGASLKFKTPDELWNAIAGRLGGMSSNQVMTLLTSTSGPGEGHWVAFHTDTDGGVDFYEPNFGGFHFDSPADLAPIFDRLRTDFYGGHTRAIFNYYTRVTPND